MTRSSNHPEPWLPDEETWDSPGRLSAADLYAHAGAGRRDGAADFDDPEDDR